MRIKRVLIAAAVAASAWATLGGGAGAATLPEGCSAAMGTSCTYVARSTGGIVAGGNGWKVTVIGKDRYTSYGPRTMTDVGKSAFKKANAVKPGDVVYVKTTLPAAPCLCVCVTGTFGFAIVGPDANS